MKSKGHIYMANLLMKEMKEKGTVTIGNFGTYCIPSDVKNAILAAPKAFRAGAVGPDFYPDMLIGQATIHPSDSGKWLTIMEQELLKTSKNSAEWNSAYAFYLGYMMHYANDMWTHDYVNGWAGGSFPSFADIQENSESAAIAIRHVLVETYIDNKIPQTESMEIEAPIDFIYRCFSSKEARACYDDQNVLNYLLNYRDEVNELASDSSIRMLDVANYFPSWEKQLDTAIMEWLKTWNKVAKDLLLDDGGMTQAKADLEYWVKTYAIEATALPVWLINAGRALKIVKVAIEAMLEPLKQMAIEVLSQMVYEATGVRIEDVELLLQELKKMMKQPELYLNNGILYEETNITPQIDVQCGNFGKSSSTLYNQTFVPFDRALNMGRLSLMGVENLNTIMQNYGSSVRFVKKQLPAAVNKLNITIKTSSKMWSGTDDNVYFGLMLSSGQVLEYLMDKPGYNDFEMGDKDTYTFQLPRTVCYDEISAIQLRKDYINIDDDWRMESMLVKDAADDFVLCNNTTGQLLTKRNKYTFPVTKKPATDISSVDSKVLSHVYSLDVVLPELGYKSWEHCFLKSSDALWTQFTKKLFKLL